jgi:hypothetical protein
MNTRLLLLSAFALASAGAASNVNAADKPKSPPAALLLSLQATTNIVFKQFYPGGEKRITVSDQAQVRRLVSSIHLEWKGPCKCEHLQGANFQGPVESMSVSFCDHCFDVGTNFYAMPKKFYSQFQKLAQKEGWRDLP